MGSSNWQCSSYHHGNGVSVPAQWVVDFMNIMGEAETDRDIAYCDDCYQTDVLSVPSLRIWISNPRQV